MAGIRLYHPTVRPEVGAQYAVFVVETDLRYPIPYLCPLCNRAEERKSIHLRIGSDGYVIVSPEVWASLQPVAVRAGLEVHETIENPPPSFLGAVELPKQHIIHQPLNQDKKWRPFYNPGRTKYESRDRLRIPRLVFRRKHG